MNRDELIKHFKVDGESLIRVTKPHNRPDLVGKLVSVRTDGNGYLTICLFGKNALLHRVIWTYFNGDIPAGLTIDHIDGNKTNNSISNLRLATVNQNNHNQRSRRVGGLPKGVYLNKGKYIAMVMCNRKSHSKYFATIEEATCWLDIKRKELHGDFANNG